MPHIKLDENLAGIRSLAQFRPDTGKALYDLAQALLKQNSSLGEADSELIATFVSHLNGCHYCKSSHGSVAKYLYGDNASTVDKVMEDYQNAPIPEKLKALLTIAKAVQKDARTVTTEIVDEAKALGASDREIHDTVLISAAFCMYNRYVDGLATISPTDPAYYEPMGERLAKFGYVPPQK
ncbi:MAG: peroxidase-related enzyme [Candidatus Kapabacteria bacterium]|nr:peroxidase-related enzyme [Candidatus Kapabacteria bacterium]